MDGWLGLLTLGLLLGMRHALDPDHVVAIGTISAQALSVRRSAGVGALWGLGHSLTIFGVGGTMVVLRATVSPRTELAMEFTVALMLIVLGVVNLVNARRPEPTVPSRVRPFLVGMVHGTAGSAAIALLVLATIPDAMPGMLYLALFGAGTLVGMIGATTLMTAPLNIAVANSAVSRRWVTAGSGAVSLVVGLVMAFDIGGPLGLLLAGAR